MEHPYGKPAAYSPRPLTRSAPVERMTTGREFGRPALTDVIDPVAMLGYLERRLGQVLQDYVKSQGAIQVLRNDRPPVQHCTVKATAWVRSDPLHTNRSLNVSWPVERLRLMPVANRVRRAEWGLVRWLWQAYQSCGWDGWDWDAVEVRWEMNGQAECVRIPTDDRERLPDSIVLPPSDTTVVWYTPPATTYCGLPGGGGHHSE